jgi:hypothetical protein
MQIHEKNGRVINARSSFAAYDQSAVQAPA